MRLLLKTLIRRCFIRHYCTPCKTQRSVAKSIYFSKSTDIFANLALEDWYYKNLDFTDHHLLMLWQNEPCVVIGRHQNPWIECNFAMLPHIANGVKLARRNSGGGTVYHDMRNLNLTFFTSRQEYCRKKNLELISRALKKSFGIQSEISPREDLCKGDFKISGTASKLGRTSAYHHCTVLVDADKKNLSLALRNTLGENVKTNASKSVKSKIINLSQEISNITVEQVIRAIILEFSNGSMKQDHFELGVNSFEEGDYLQGAKIIESIDEETFPGIIEIKNTFLSHEWRFAKTPKFEIFRSIFSDLNNAASDSDLNDPTAFLIVEQGKVTDLGIKSKEKTLSVLNNDLGELSELFNDLVGKIFSKDVLDEFEIMIGGLKNSKICRTMVLNKN